MNFVETYIIISGGRSTRFGSDKATFSLDGATLLARHLSALGNSKIIVVGEKLDGDFPLVQWVREDPPFSGPVAALEAGVNAIESAAQLVAVLAVDMPYAVRALSALSEHEMGDHEALVPSDEEGFPQPLCAIYSVSALRNALVSMAPVAGKSMRTLLTHLDVCHIRLSDDVQYALVDIDTPSDVEKVRNARMD